MRSVGAWFLAASLMCLSLAFWIRSRSQLDDKSPGSAARPEPVDVDAEIGDATRGELVPVVVAPAHPPVELAEVEPEKLDVSQLGTDDLLKLLEKREIAARDLAGLADSTLDELAVLRSEAVLAGWTGATREAALDTLCKLPSQLPNPAGKALSARDLKHLDSMRDRYSETLAALSQDALQELEAHKQALWNIRQGVRMRREGETPPPAEGSTRGKFRSSQECGMFGRYVRFEYSSDGCHALESKLALLEDLKSQLRSEQLHYIDSLP